MSDNMPHVVGIKPPDERWKKMKAVYDACVAAEAKVPKEVDDYFDNEPPDESGVVVDLSNCMRRASGALGHHPSVTEWSDEDSCGCEIDISKLPKDVKIVRVFQSW